MRARISLLMLVLLLAVASSWAQDTAKERVIELKDGGRLVLRADGTMGHYSAAGSPMVMPEGDMMIAKDGTRIMMKSDTLWWQIVEQAIEQAALNFALASTFPWHKNAANEQWIELADGGRIMLRGNGTMVHFNAAGAGIRMAEGEVMIAKDGTPILMNKGTLWTPTADRRAPWCLE